MKMQAAHKRKCFPLFIFQDVLLPPTETKSDKIIKIFSTAAELIYMHCPIIILGKKCFQANRQSSCRFIELRGCISMCSKDIHKCYRNIHILKDSRNLSHNNVKRSFRCTIFQKLL